MIDANYADDRVLLTNTPAQSESLLNSLEQPAKNIGLHMNANKTEYICFKQKNRVHVSSPVSGKPLKLVDQFIYFGCNISSTESDIDLHLVKTWNAMVGYWSYRNLIYPIK